MPVYATHGVEDPANGDGFEIFDVKIRAKRVRADHLNPQTQEFLVERDKDDDDDRDDKSKDERDDREHEGE